MTAKHFWAVAYYVLLALFVVTAALNMLSIRAGFLTNHAADVVVPAWMYVVSRGLHPVRAAPGLLQRTIGRSAGFAALALFGASAITEVSQYYWPRGIFPGRFDPFDLVAFGVGIGACFVAERWRPAPTHRSQRGQSPNRR